MGRHKEWRKMAKKMMRKRKRAQKAKERDELLRLAEEKRTQSPSYELWLEEQEKLELFRQEEESRLREEENNRWLREEQLAQERWAEQQKRLERLKAEKAKQELIIKEEWEQEQTKLKADAEKREQEKQRKEREQAELLDRIESYIAGESDQLPSCARSVGETQPGCPECPFFSKVAACRFRDDCSRNHIRPNISKTLLLPGFYTDFRIEHMNQSNEYDTDVGLEFDDKEIYEDFLEFYDDVLCEMKKFGPVVQFKVCCNEEPHLRGNVYVQFSEERYAMKAFRALQGRYYGGKRISVEFCNINSWSKALCGLHYRKKCPKGGKCNFLHVFRNPDREFYNADRDIFMNSRSSFGSKEKMDWNWSPSPEKRERASTSRRNYSERTKKNEDEDRRIPKEKQNWNWSPSPERISQRRHDESSHRSKHEYSNRSSKYESKRYSESESHHKKSRKRERDDRYSDDSYKQKKKSKENRSTKRNISKDKEVES